MQISAATAQVVTELAYARAGVYMERNDLMCSEMLALDLQQFAAHANRATVLPADVLLASRFVLAANYC